jgi:hypothetical protein
VWVGAVFRNIGREGWGCIVSSTEGAEAGGLGRGGCLLFADAGLGCGGLPGVGWAGLAGGVCLLSCFVPDASAPQGRSIWS